MYRARWLRGNARDSHSGGPGFKSRCRPTWLGLFRGFPQSSRQMLGWIFITTIHLIIIHQFHISHLISLSKFKLPLIGTFTWPTPPGPYRATTCRGREVNYGYTYILFWPHKDMEGLPGWVISPMPGPPPRRQKHERQYSPSTHSVIPKRRICNDDYDGQMIFGDLGGLKFPDICLTDEGKPRKNLTQETCPDRGLNPGPLRDKRACYHLLHRGSIYHNMKKKAITHGSGNFRLHVALHLFIEDVQPDVHSWHLL